MLKVFISSKCPDCPPAIENINRENLNYELIDITNSMRELKEFLKLRDTNPYFDSIKIKNNVGIPIVYIEELGKVYSLEGDVDYNFLKKYTL